MRRVLFPLFAAALVLVSSAPSRAAGTEQRLPFNFTTTLAAGAKYKFTFSLYDTAAPGSGSRLWSESKTYTVPASKALAHVLGSIVPFSKGGAAGDEPVDFSRQLWVEVTAGTFVRRFKLAAAPYALWSATADTLGIECAPGEILIVDGAGAWACGTIPTPQLCATGDVLGCYTGAPATQGVGLCRNGTRSCQSGAWGQCTGQTLPQPEDVVGTERYCNGLDDNCDGVLGVHEADQDGDGYLACNGDCNDNDPMISPEWVEMCDGVDNNCDGQTDEVCVCGDGTVMGGEECDDGNTAGGDGCSGQCIVEQGWECQGQPSVCAPL